MREVTVTATDRQWSELARWAVIGKLAEEQQRDDRTVPESAIEGAGVEAPWDDRPALGSAWGRKRTPPTVRKYRREWTDYAEYSGNVSWTP